MADVVGAVSGAALLRSVLEFGRELRAEGLAADLATVLDYARALELVDIGDREDVRTAGAALFIRRRDDIEPYERAFARFWRARKALRRQADSPGLPEPSAGRDAARETSGDLRGRSPSEIVSMKLAEEGADEQDRVDGLTTSPHAWSAQESMRTKSFERMTPAELREAERAIDAMVLRLPQRRTRRWDLHRRGSLLAPREMLRRNLSSGGDLVEWVWRRPARKPRSVVLLCDISGSMERHSRLLVRFSHAMSRSGVRTEAFAFGTRLTRITPHLRGRNPDRALREVSEAVGDWSGGTRIGSSFREFNVRWARRVLRSSGIVIVVSDGWDRGDPAVVGEETARLRRNCHRLIWLNPLAGASGYQPLAAGMAAAYPHIDRFLPAHDLASLEHLAELLATGAFSREPTAGRSAGARAAGAPAVPAAGSGQGAAA